VSPAKTDKLQLSWWGGAGSCASNLPPSNHELDGDPHPPQCMRHYWEMSSPMKSIVKHKIWGYWIFEPVETDEPVRMIFGDRLVWANYHLLDGDA